MAQHQEVSKHQGNETSYNPLEEGVQARLLEVFDNSEEPQLYAFALPYDETTNLETVFYEGILKGRDGLKLFSTIGAGGTQLEGKVGHFKEGKGNVEYDLGIEYWTLADDYDEKDADRKGNILFGLADHAARGYVTKKPTMPGTVYVSGFQQGTYKAAMILPFDPVFRTEIHPVVADDTAVHFLYVLPITENEANILRDRPEAGEELLDFIKELGRDAYKATRPSPWEETETIEETDMKTKGVTDTTEHDAGAEDKA